MAEMTPVVKTASASMIFEITWTPFSCRSSVAGGVVDRLVGAGAIPPGLLRIQVALAAEVPQPRAPPGAVGAEVVRRLEGHLSAPARKIHGEVRDGEAARAAAELLEDRDARLERGAQVPRPLGEIALVEVVGPHAPLEQALEQVLQDARRGVHAAQEHGLVLDRDAGIHERLARGARLFRALLRMIEVRHDEEGSVLPQQAREARVDAHGAHDRSARRDPHDPDVRNGADGGEELLEPAVVEDEGIASG